MKKGSGGKQKIGLERIYRLFELAQKASAEGKAERAKRYVALAKRIGEKTRAGIPKELKEKHCKKCLSVKVEAKEEKPFLVVKCKECGFVKRFGLGEKKKEAAGSKEKNRRAKNIC